MPTTVELQSLLTWTHARGLTFTLVTPVLVEPMRPRLHDLLATLLPLFAAGDEVVISDWGGLDLVRSVRPDVPIVLGRVLSGQKRDARNVALDPTAPQRRHFRQGSWYSAPAVELLLDLNIHRVELDNLLQGVAPLPTGLRGTLHRPFAMVAASRNCPFRGAGTVEPCPRPCGVVFTLTSAAFPVPLLQGGNVQFLRNDRVPDDLAALGIDRVVGHLELSR